MILKASVFVVLIGMLVLGGQKLLDMGESNDIPPWPIYRAAIALFTSIETVKSLITPPPVRILELANSFWQTQALRVAAELQIADILHNDGPKTCAELSMIIGNREGTKPIHAENLCRVMRALESVRVFYEEGDITSTGNSGKWHNTRSSSVLRKDHPASQRGWVINAGMTHYIPMERLIHSVRTGECAFEHLHQGQPFFDYLAAHPIEGEYFHQGMHNLQLVTGQQSVEDYPNWFSFTSGGGEGRLVAALLHGYPSIEEAILFDLPEVIELSKKRFITEESDYVANRTRFVAGDFFSGLVPQSDAYILKWILHDWDDQHCMQILNNIKASMKPSSKLLIIDEVLTKYDPLPVKKRFSDLVMMTMLHGKERAKEDFQSLFEAVGLKLDGVFNMRGPVSLIQASLRHSD